MILYEIIDYIQQRINADEELADDIEVLEAYKYAHKVNKTEIQAQIIDHSEFVRFTTFEDGKVFVSPLQFNIFSTQLNLNVIPETSDETQQETEPSQETEDDEPETYTVSAQKGAYILAQKIIDYLNTIELHEAIPEVLGAKNGTYISARPFDTGTVLYQTVVRVDIYLERS